jgi:hypothetical protein
MSALHFSRWPAHMRQGDDWNQQAIDELWTEEAAKWAAENPDDIQCALDNTDLLQRMARATAGKVSDEVLRGFATELMEVIRDVQILNEGTINKRCIRRGEEERREARDMVRGWE